MCIVYGCTDHDGRLTGADAVKFFERSGLPRDQLAKVWAMADSSRRGYLDQASFAQVHLRDAPRPVYATSMTAHVQRHAIGVAVRKIKLASPGG